MEMTAYTPGTPSWVDIGTADVDAARAFYSAVFGWDIPEGNPEFGGYTMASLNGKQICGFGPQQNPGPPYWTSYVTVEDVDASAATVVEAGGQVLAPPMEVGTAGKMAVLMDPQGAAFAIWQAGETIGCELVNEPGALCWNELNARDVDAALAFYPKVFGWGSQTSTEGPFPYTEWKLGEDSIGGLMAMPPMVPEQVPSFWLVYFAVADCDATLAKITELGGSSMMPPMDIPIGRFAVVTDPEGATFAIIALSGERM